MPKANTTSMDLKCSLCPKNPTFSDTSHLLTHMSSKSHLAHRFKLQIRASGEAAAKAELDGFDKWYQDNNLDSLLAERMNAKEQKKVGKEKKARKPAVPKKEPAKNEKKEVEVAQQLQRTPLYRAPTAGMHPWSQGIHQSGSDSLIDWEQSAYETPSARRPIPGYSVPDTPVGNQLDPKLTTPWNPTQNEEKSSEGKSTDSATKLKGVIWPGMDIFDAATPEQKRMRNQRKDSYVLAGMKATSSAVEPAEISYHPNGEFRGSRDIFGSPSPFGSPEDEKAPSPKKRKSRKGPLEDKSVNGAPGQLRTRIQRPRRAARKSVQESPSPVKHEALTNPLFSGPVPALNPLAGFGGRYVDAHDDFKLDSDALGRVQKKRAFKVFREAPELSPGKTESPLEDHRFDYHSYPTTSYMGGMMAPASNVLQASPTPVARPTFLRTSGKENGQSETTVLRQPLQSDPFLYAAMPFNENYQNPLFQAFQRQPARSSYPINEPQYGYNDGPHDRFGQYRVGYPFDRTQQHDHASSSSGANNSTSANPFGL